jgi:uncharacterized membrane protein YeaQ/YmgE (transglycosylase-associated protein family)
MLLHLLIGGIAGWLAGKFMRGAGYGVIFDIILGVIGGWVGIWIAPRVGIHLYGTGGYLVLAFLGAIILVAISRLFRHRRTWF